MYYSNKSYTHYISLTTNTSLYKVLDIAVIQAISLTWGTGEHFLRPHAVFVHLGDPHITFIFCDPHLLILDTHPPIVYSICQFQYRLWGFFTTFFHYETLLRHLSFWDLHFETSILRPPCFPSTICNGIALS